VKGRWLNFGSSVNTWSDIQVFMLNFKVVQWSALLREALINVHPWLLKVSVVRHQQIRFLF
jgi:hypothetical protein